MIRFVSKLKAVIVPIKKKRIAFAIILLLASCSDSGFGEHSSYYSRTIPYPTQENACDFWGSTQKFVEFWLGIPKEFGEDVELRFPYEYVSGGSVRMFASGRADGAALLHVRLNDFAPFTHKEELVSLKSEELKSARLLISNPGFDPVKQIVNSRVYLNIDEVKNIPKQNHEIFNDLFTLPDRGALNYSYERFAGYKNGELVSLIRCSKPKKNASLRHLKCRHSFEAGRVSVQLSYDRKVLHRWTELEEKSRQLTACSIK